MPVIWSSAPPCLSSMHGRYVMQQQQLGMCCLTLWGGREGLQPQALWGAVPVLSSAQSVAWPSSAEALAAVCTGCRYNNVEVDGGPPREVRVSLVLHHVFVTDCPALHHPPTHPSCLAASPPHPTTQLSSMTPVASPAQSWAIPHLVSEPTKAMLLGPVPLDCNYEISTSSSMRKRGR
jgi:hypothetical protein